MWHAYETQLDRLYTSDPDASGYGIYGIFWFGPRRPRRMPARPDGGQSPQSATEIQQILAEMIPPEKREGLGVVVLDLSGPPTGRQPGKKRPVKKLKRSTAKKTKSKTARPSKKKPANKKTAQHLLPENLLPSPRLSKDGGEHVDGRVGARLRSIFADVASLVSGYRLRVSRRKPTRRHSFLKSLATPRIPR